MCNRRRYYAKERKGTGPARAGIPPPSPLDRGGRFGLGEEGLLLFLQIP